METGQDANYKKNCFNEVNIDKDINEVSGSDKEDNQNSTMSND